MRLFASIVLLLGSLPAPSPAAADVSATATYGEETLLKGFALAQCLGKALPHMREEANSAAGGYMEFGSVGVEAYEEMAALAGEFAERDYAAKSGSKLSIMKCFDLLNSRELSEIVKRYGR